MLSSTSSAPNEGSGPASTVDSLCDFLEVFIHAVLCTRRVYPETLFESRFAYGIPVKASRHPELNQYISDAVSAIRTELVKAKEPGDAMINIVDGAGVPIESFVLEISAIAGPYSNRHDVELRAALIRINTLEAVALPKGATFQVCYRARDGEAPSLDKNEWVPQISDASGQKVERNGDKAPRLVPLSSVNGDSLKAQAFAILRRDAISD